MKALSIRQPWAWLILHAGKDIENREWGNRSPSLNDARRLIGQRVLLHTGKGMTRGGYEDARDFACSLDPKLSVPAFGDLPRGGLVGVFTLKGIVFDRHPSPWFFGPVGLLIEKPIPLPFHPMNGALGFFDAGVSA